MKKKKSILLSSKGKDTYQSFTEIIKNYLNKNWKENILEILTGHQGKKKMPSNQFKEVAVMIIYKIACSMLSY